MDSREINEYCCVICLDDTVDEDNALIYCDGAGCDIGVHQACYGVPELPAEDESWLCSRCQKGIGLKVNCCFCPFRKGAFKQTDTGEWAHIVCALYLPEVKFGDLEHMEPIIVSEVTDYYRGRCCYICEEKNRVSNSTKGACILCNVPDCNKAFHITCAQRLLLLREEESTDSSGDILYTGYCSKHIGRSSKKNSQVSRADQKTPKNEDISGKNSHQEEKPPGNSLGSKSVKNSAKNSDSSGFVKVKRKKMNDSKLIKQSVPLSSKKMASSQNLPVASSADGKEKKNGNDQVSKVDSVKVYGGGGVIGKHKEEMDELGVDFQLPLEELLLKVSKNLTRGFFEVISEAFLTPEIAQILETTQSIKDECQKLNSQLSVLQQENTSLIQIQNCLSKKIDHLNSSCLPSKIPDGSVEKTNPTIMVFDSKESKDQDPQASFSSADEESILNVETSPCLLKLFQLLNGFDDSVLNSKNIFQYCSILDKTIYSTRVQSTQESISSYLGRILALVNSRFLQNIHPSIP